MKIPKVSIVIPTKNGGELFGHVLERIDTQKTNWPYEVIVIDSGSTDSTKTICNSYANVKLYCIKPNEFGHGKTRNLGIKMSSGEYIALLTQDALPVDEYWLENLVLAMEQDESIAGVFGKHIAYPGANPFTANELTLHFKGFDDSPSISFIDDQKRYIEDEGYRQFLHFFSDNNALIRRSIWERYPYPDVDFAEDQIWADNIMQAGYKKAYAKKAVVFHSHEYSLYERLQRSFDEANAFRKLFNYSLCKSKKHLLKNWISLSSRDFKHAFDQKLFKSSPGAVLKSPIDNLMRLTGHYLGSIAHRLPFRFQQKLSRDKQIKLGIVLEMGEL